MHRTYGPRIRRVRSFCSVGVALVAFLAFGCADTQADDRTDARDNAVYSEDSTIGELEVWADRGLKVTAEYHPVATVLVSIRLLTEPETNELLAKAILDAGANLIVVVEKELDGGLSNTAFDKLRATLGNRHQPLETRISILKNDRGAPLVWTRDSAPLMAKASDGTAVLLDFNYHRGSGPTSGPKDEIADYVPRALANASGLPRVSVPVYNEGGNFMINDDGLCLMTDRVEYLNAKPHRLDLDPTEKAATEEQVRERFQTYAGCRDVRIVPGWDFTTDHIDMWAKFLSNDVLAIATLTDQTIDSMKEGEARELAKELQSYLRARNTEMRANYPNLKLIEIPMAPPSESQAYEGWNVKGYANSLLVNGTAIIPSWKNGNPDNDSMIAPYEEQAAQAYTSAGFKPVFVPALDLIDWGGAVHCVTMQYAQNITLR